MLLAAPGRAAAQDDDPAASARFRVGPVRFTPAISVTNLGVNTNVFNEVDNPRSDTTAAIGPVVNAWMNVGRSRLSGRASGQYLYFDKYADQRAWGTSDDGRWEFPLGRITPFVTGSYTNTRQQQGYEIDVYARQRTNTLGGGADIQVGGKTKVTVSGTRGQVAYDDNATFLGVGLAGTLNHKSDIEQVQVRYTLTPLTTFVVGGLLAQDRFDADPVRDANSTKIMPGLEFKPFALVSGTVAVGYRWFRALDKTTPDSQGVIATVDARYVIGPTRLVAKVSRDLTYSFEPDQPYYTLTDLTLSATEQLSSAWDIVGRGGWQSLDYSRFATSLAPVGRVDTVRQYGAGIGYRVGHTVRIGFDTTYYRRRSAAEADRGYEGYRSGISISYGIQP